MRELVLIDPRFCGPSDSGNGGYTCGLLARHVRGAAEVTLRRPPPLGRELLIEHEAADDSSARLLDGDTLVAEAHSTVALSLTMPAPLSFSEAEACATRYAGFSGHRFPRCFVCGPERAAGDGLRIFPGPAPDGSCVAAPFVPHATWAGVAADADGTLALQLTWAALDCPGYFAAASSVHAVLGRMSAEVLHRPRIGEPHVVMGWALGQQGRKYEAGTALFDAAGKLCARSRQTWIALL